MSLQSWGQILETEQEQICRYRKTLQRPSQGGHVALALAREELSQVSLSINTIHIKATV